MQCSSQELGSIWWHIGWPRQLMKYVMPKTNVSSLSKPFRCVIITGWGSISQDKLNVNDVKEPQQNNSFVKPAHLNTSRALIDFSDDICASNVWKMTATIVDVARTRYVSWIKICITLTLIECSYYCTVHLCHAITGEYVCMTSTYGRWFIVQMNYLKWQHCGLHPLHCMAAGVLLGMQRGESRLRRSLHERF